MNRISDFIKEPFVERRVEQITFYTLEDRRFYDYDYSNPTPLFRVSVKCEPQPEGYNEIVHDIINRRFWLTHRGTKEKFSQFVPLKPNDQVVLEDETHKVLAVLGCDEIDRHLPPNPPSKVVNENWKKLWHFIYLTEKCD